MRWVRRAMEAYELILRKLAIRDDAYIEFLQSSEEGSLAESTLESKARSLVRIVALAARRWPVIAAPKVSGDTIVEGVQEHPKFADHFRKRFDPKTETGIALIIATALVLGATVGIGVVVAMIRTHQGLASLDLRFANYGAHNASHMSTVVMTDISRIGGTPLAVGLAVVATVIAMIRRPSKAVPLFMVLVVGGQFLLSNSIKFLVHRARPDIDRLTGFAGTSFPSGPLDRRGRNAGRDRADSHPQHVQASQDRRRGDRSRSRGDGRVHPRAARRPLVHRRCCRPPARLGLVRRVLDRLRRSPAELRSACRHRWWRRCRHASGRCKG